MSNKGDGALGCLGEIFGELILTAIFFGIGWLILSLLGIELDAEGVDADLVTLLGIGALLAVFGVIYLITRLIKRGGNTDADGESDEEAINQGETLTDTYNKSESDNNTDGEDSIDC